jgi:hypothetical protein
VPQGDAGIDHRLEVFDVAAGMGVGHDRDGRDLAQWRVAGNPGGFIQGVDDGVGAANDEFHAGLFGAVCVDTVRWRG